MLQEQEVEYIPQFLYSKNTYMWLGFDCIFYNASGRQGMENVDLTAEKNQSRRCCLGKDCTAD